MAITYTPQDLFIRYQEFSSLPVDLVKEVIDEARAFLGGDGAEERYGSLYKAALAAQTGELLSRSPYGQPARQESSDGRTQYWRTLDDIKKRLPYRMLVTG